MIKPILLFLQAFDSQNVHNMIAIMLDPHFKSLQVVENYEGHEEAIHFAFEYDAKVAIPLFIICFDRFNPISQTCVIAIDVLIFQFEKRRKYYVWCRSNHGRVISCFCYWIFYF